MTGLLTTGAFTGVRAAAVPHTGPGWMQEAEGAALAPAQEESGSACHKHRDLERRCCQDQDFSCRTHEASTALRQE